MKKPKTINADQCIAAINRHDLAKLREYIEAGADPNATKDFAHSRNVTLLNAAARCQFLEAVELLIVAGADPNIAETPGRGGEGAGGAPLHSAISGIDPHTRANDIVRRLHIVDLLLKAGANPNAVRDGRELPLYNAAAGGYETILERLIEAGAHASSYPAGCIPPLVGAALGVPPHNLPEGRSFLPVVRLLLDRGAPIDGQNSLGLTALMGAAYRGSELLINLLLEYGANVNYQSSKDGRTPLICAVQYDRLAVTDEDHQTALRVVQCLVKAGANLQARNAKGETALDIAGQTGHPLVLNYLTQL